MHLHFYLITACFLVLPRMCETSKDIHERARLLVWKRRDPAFVMRSAREVNASGCDCLSRELVKTCENKKGFKRGLKSGFWKSSFILLERSRLPEPRFQYSMTPCRPKNEMLKVPFFREPLWGLCCPAVTVLLALHHCHSIWDVADLSVRTCVLVIGSLLAPSAPVWISFF